MLIKYLESRTNDYKHHKHIHRIHLHLASINTHGKAVDSDELVAALDANKNNQHVKSSWKDDAAEFVDTHLGRIPWKDALLHLDIHPDSVLLQIQCAAGLLRDKAIRSRSKNSSASWKKFCLDQLTKGAGKLHSWANRPNSLPSVPLFDNNTKSKTPLAVLQDKTKHWAKYWQKPSERNALEVIDALRTACKKALDANSTSNVWDAPTFDGDALTLSAKKYKKRSKGSGHWLASEFDLPKEVIQPIAQAIDNAVVQLAIPHQMLLNLNPELAKASGGTRTITKTPIVYRLWCRTRKIILDEWEGALDKQYDTAVKGSSALIAAANRAVIAEIHHRNGSTVANLMLDMEFFLTPLILSPCLMPSYILSFPLLMRAWLCNNTLPHVQCKCKASQDHTSEWISLS